MAYRLIRYEGVWKEQYCTMIKEVQSNCTMMYKAILAMMYRSILYDDVKSISTRWCTEKYCMMVYRAILYDGEQSNISRWYKE